MRKRDLKSLKTRKEDESFHLSRIMFCLKNGELKIGPKNTSQSHFEWFKKEGWLNEKNAEEFLETNVRGFYLPVENKLYIYRGINFQFDEKVIIEFLKNITNFKKHFKLNVETKIHLGPKDSTINKKEYPQKFLGKIKELKEIKVELISAPQNAQTIAVASALGCFENRTSSQILEDFLKLPKEERLKKEKAVLKNSFGRGHGSVGDQIHFTFSIENLPRIATLFLCLPEYLEHLQQSLRRAKADRGFYLPEIIKNSNLADKTKKLLNSTFDFYERACQAGIPAEDARFLLPLYTKTNITTTGNARELCHLFSMSNRPNVPNNIFQIVSQMIKQSADIAPYLFEDFGFNYEILSWYPSSQLFGSSNSIIQKFIKSFEENGNKWLLNWTSPFEVTSDFLTKTISGRDETGLANLKHIHFEFLVPMSLICFHQAIRQRTWNHSIESIYQAAEDALVNPEKRIVIPPLINNSVLVSEYKELNFSLLNLYQELINEGIPKSEAIGILPHALKIYDWVHINGWNAIHSIGKRTCAEAQWEIRLIARKIAKSIKEVIPAFRDWAEPQCITYGKCPEIKDCGYYKNRKKD